MAKLLQMASDGGSTKKTTSNQFASNKFTSSNPLINGSANRSSSTAVPPFKTGYTSWGASPLLRGGQYNYTPVSRNTGTTYVYNPKSTGTSYASSRSSSRSSISGGGKGSYKSYAARRTSAAAASAAAATSAKAAKDKKENDETKRQVDALKSMIDSKFGAVRDSKLKDLDDTFATSDKVILTAFNDRLKQLLGSKEDNEKSEHDATTSNTLNRIRERTDLMSEALSQGAGETDLLRTQMMAMRNWSANQQDVSRSYFDTLRSVNNTITDLNQDTKQSRVNAANQLNKDKATVWDTYQNQVTDTWNQIANIENSNTNDSFTKQYADAMQKAAESAGTTWKDPGVSKEITDWTGQKVEEGHLNNSDAWSTPRGDKQSKRPEGATLRKW